MTGICSIEGCDRPHTARGFCGTHYASWRTGRLKAEAREIRAREVRICEQCAGPIPATRRKGVMFCGSVCKRRAQYDREKARPEPKQNPPCTVEECQTPIMARGLCQKHYNRLLAKGSTDETRKNARAECVVDGCTRGATAYGYCHNHKGRAPEYVARRAAKLAATRKGRTCLCCGEDIPMDRPSDSIYCSFACKVKQRADDGRTRESSLRHYFGSRYGLTPEQVDQMAEAGCAICGTFEWSGAHNRPHVDHDHATGKVRGILCNACNLGLGRFRDDPLLLRAAADYLERAAVPSS